MNKYIIPYNKFKINELSEFNLGRLNPDSGSMAVHVDNPQLSINAFDKHQDAIRAATSKINGLLRSLSNSTQFNILKSKLALKDQNIDSLKVLRISKLNSINYTVYISFTIGEEEYWGVVENILSDDPDFKSEVFKDTRLILSPEWIIKIKGLVIKVLKKWLRPENGSYKLINKEAFFSNINTGRLIEVSKGVEIEVIKSFDNKIVVKYNDDLYNLSGDNYIYFNYWFLKSI